MARKSSGGGIMPDVSEMDPEDDQDPGTEEYGGERSPSNGGKKVVENAKPYAVEITIVGKKPLMLHAWNVEAIEEKGAAAKGSKSKKSDDVESFVVRNEDGVICIPASYMLGAITDTAKSFSDPRSPRKSLRDMMKAALAIEPELIPLAGNPKTWDYIDKRRVRVQTSAVTRSRPCFKEGWSVTFIAQIGVPEFVPQDKFHEVIEMTGKVNGLAELRPSYGRFHVTRWEPRILES